MLMHHPLNAHNEISEAASQKIRCWPNEQSMEILRRSKGPRLRRKAFGAACIVERCYITTRTDTHCDMMSNYCKTLAFLLNLIRMAGSDCQVLQEASTLSQ